MYNNDQIDSNDYYFPNMPLFSIQHFIPTPEGERFTLGESDRDVQEWPVRPGQRDDLFPAILFRRTGHHPDIPDCRLSDAHSNSVHFDRRR